MKKLLILPLIFFILKCNGQSAIDSLLLKKNDSILSAVKIINVNKNDSTFITIDKLDEIFKKSEQNWYEKFMPSIIALMTVLISAGVAYYVGVRNARTQITNAKTQANIQVAIAADQLQISRQQIEQNTKNTLAQIRSNNISKARIEWIQNLRPLLSDFFANISKASIIIDESVKAKKSGKEDEMSMHIESFKEIVFKLEAQNNQIDLFLNPDRISHKELEESISELLGTINLSDKMELPDNKEQIDKVIAKSRIVIKEAWEQAKSESEI